MYIYILYIYIYIYIVYIYIYIVYIYIYCIYMYMTIYVLKIYKTLIKTTASCGFIERSTNTHRGDLLQDVLITIQGIKPWSIEHVWSIATEQNTYFHRAKREKHMKQIMKKPSSFRWRDVIYVIIIWREKCVLHLFLDEDGKRHNIRVSLKHIHGENDMIYDKMVQISWKHASDRRASLWFQEKHIDVTHLHQLSSTCKAGKGQ